jgi:hypothetical protein
MVVASLATMKMAAYHRRSETVRNQKFFGALQVLHIRLRNPAWLVSKRRPESISSLPAWRPPHRLPKKTVTIVILVVVVAIPFMRAKASWVLRYDDRRTVTDVSEASTAFFFSVK